MARYYKTSSATPLEYMHKLPIELMSKVLQNEDLQINNIVSTADLYGNSVLQIPHLAQDGELIKSKQDYYKGKTVEITQTILNSGPGTWKKYQGVIRDLGSELEKDLMSGELSKVKGSYETFQNYLKQYEKALE